VIDKKTADPKGAEQLGMYLMLASLAVLFLASLLGYVYIRIHATEWPPSGMPGFPPGLWFSTVIILGCSVAIDRALRAVRRDDDVGLHRGLIVTFALGTLFLVLQLLNYWGLAQASLTAATNLYGFTFYMLTGLHAAHVIGGLIPLGIVLRKSRGHAYSSTDHAGVGHVAVYWHFLDVVWLILFFVLLIGS